MFKNIKTLSFFLVSFLLISFSIASNAKLLKTIKVEIIPEGTRIRTSSARMRASMISPFYKAHVVLPDGQIIEITPENLGTVITLPTPIEITNPDMDMKVFAFCRTTEKKCPYFCSGKFERFFKTKSNAATMRLFALGPPMFMSWIDQSKE